MRPISLSDGRYGRSFRHRDARHVSTGDYVQAMAGGAGSASKWTNASRAATHPPPDHDGARRAHRASPTAFSSDRPYSSKCHRATSTQPVLWVHREGCHSGFNDRMTIRRGDAAENWRRLERHTAQQPAAHHSSGAGCPLDRLPSG
jgi:hypothetical protein